MIAALFCDVSTLLYFPTRKCEYSHQSSYMLAVSRAQTVDKLRFTPMEIIKYISCASLKSFLPIKARFVFRCSIKLYSYWITVRNFYEFLTRVPSIYNSFNRTKESVQRAETESTFFTRLKILWWNCRWKYYSHLSSIILLCIVTFAEHSRVSRKNVCWIRDDSNRDVSCHFEKNRISRQNTISQYQT